jgi:hypothetical protein
LIRAPLDRLTATERQADEELSRQEKSRDKTVNTAGDVMNSSSSVTLAGRRSYRGIGCQDAASASSLLLMPPVVERPTTLTKFVTRRTLAAE